MRELIESPEVMPLERIECRGIECLNQYTKKLYMDESSTFLMGCGDTCLLIDFVYYSFQTDWKRS